MAFEGGILGARMVRDFLAYLIECTAMVDHHEAARGFSRFRVKVDLSTPPPESPSPGSLAFVPESPIADGSDNLTGAR